MGMMLCGDRKESGGEIRLGLMPILMGEEIAASDEAAIDGEELLRRGKEWGVVRGAGNWIPFNLYLLRAMIPEGWLGVGRVIMLPNVAMVDSTDERWMVGLYCSGDGWQIELYATSEVFGKDAFFLAAADIPELGPAKRHDDGFLGSGIGP